MKQHAQPWLFHRMVDLNLLSAELPVYVFSDAASREVAFLNGRTAQERLAEIAPFPHDSFAVEMTVPDVDQEGVFFRTLTVVQFSPLDERIAAGAKYQVLEVQCNATGITILPPILIEGPGKFLAILNGDENALGFIAEATDLQFEIVRARANKNSKHYDKVFTADYTKARAHFGAALAAAEYNKRAGEASGFLTTACAVLASPASKLERNLAKAKSPVAKRIRGRADVQWTHVDINLNRATASGDAHDASRSGVALHPVRSHLRVTQHGLSTVRAHMRGDAQFGVRHRVGHVHNGEH